MKEKIHIAVCLDKGYVMPTGVMMYSVCVNNQDVDIDFHMLIDDCMTENEQQDLKDTVTRFQGKRCLFYSVKSLSAIHFPINLDRLPQSAYYRLFLSDILPSTIEKVLYLDGDIIVRHSLLSLWNVDLGDNAVGAAMDVCDGDIKRYNRLKYPFEKGHFNTGVLLINLKYWRDNHVEKAFMKYLTEFPDRIVFADQDVMNVIFQDKKLKLPVKYNLQTAFLSNDPCWDYWKHESEVKMGIEDPVVVHFTSKWKPWYADLRFPHPYRNTFFRYQSQTKWKNCSYDRRSLYMKIRNCIGNILRKIGVKKQVDNIFNEIPPID
jgi:lipopolysaccharide biosynthesis glycosyltransferase